MPTAENVALRTRGLKRCTGPCGEVKSREDFYRNGRWVAGECKACRYAKTKSWRKKPEHRVLLLEQARRRNAKHPDKTAANAHRYVLKQKGLTPEQYEAMLAAQGGGCAICGAKEPRRGAKFFPLDHDHETNAVRGLLCSNCNLGLGNFGDDPAKLMAAVDYLLKFKTPKLVASNGRVIRQET